MKYIILFLVLLLSLGKNYSQVIKADDLLNSLKSGDAVKAKELADKAILQNSASSDPAIWFYRGQIYLAIFGSPYESIQKLSPDALEQSYIAFQKTLQLDKTKNFHKETIEAMQSIASQFNYEGANLFNQKKYNKALEYFENAIAINKMPAINKFDTIVYYNTALAAEKVGNINKSIQYYELLKQSKFGGSNIYIELGKLYCSHENESKGIQTFKEGISLFPNESNKFYNEIINYYLQKNNNSEVLKYVDEALKTDTKNPSLYFIKGSILEQNGKEADAENLYKKALEINPIYQDALYNLGVMYYNRATTMIKKAMNKTDQNKAVEMYGKAQKYLETYNNNYTREELILKMLKTIYTLTNQNDKLNQVNEWLKEF